MTLREIIEEKYGTVYRFRKETEKMRNLYSVLSGRIAPSRQQVQILEDSLGVDMRPFLDEKGRVLN